MQVFKNRAGALAGVLAMAGFIAAMSINAQEVKEKKPDNPPPHRSETNKPPKPAPSTTTHSTPTGTSAPAVHPPSGSTGTPPVVHSGGGSSSTAPAIHPHTGPTSSTPVVHSGGGSTSSAPVGAHPGGYTPPSNPPNRTGPTNQDFHRSDVHGSGDLTRHANGQPAVYHGPNNSSAHFRQDGHVAVVHKDNLTIVHSSVGERRVYVEHPDHTVIYSRGPGHGYVQRPLVVNHTAYVTRTYFVNNVSYVRVYRPYSYFGFAVNVYAPVRYYPAGFYGWAYTPWPRPVPYRWAWYSSPWYSHYGWYFTPYPVYASPALWLTDYILATTLETAYRNQAAANMAYAQTSGQTTLTPEVKQAIADEVQRQIAYEKAESQNAAQTSANGVPPTLSGSSHVFVVYRSLDVPEATNNGMECLLTEGDVLQLSGGLYPNSEVASVRVLASKGRDCRQGGVVSVQVQELVEMQNRMREQIDLGLDQLRTNQGREGLPALPNDARSAPAPASFAASIPPADPNDLKALNQQEQQAAQVEQEVVTQATGSEPAATPAAAPTMITLGQTIDQVVAQMGQPIRIVDLGAKKIYVYKDLKITFTDEHVSDVQ